MEEINSMEVANNKVVDKLFEQYEEAFADDCIHLHACRRMQCIAKDATGKKITRFCNSKCEAYESEYELCSDDLEDDEIIEVIKVEDVEEIVYKTYLSLEYGCSFSDAFCISDCDEYSFKIMDFEKLKERL